MAFENLPENLPGDVSTMIESGIATQAEALQYLNEKYPTWEDKPLVEKVEVQNTPQDAPQETKQVETTETSEPVPPAPSFDFAEFGVMDKDELKAKIDDYRKLKELEENFIAFEKIKGDLEVPYANETIAKINGVVKTLGVSDVSLAAEIASITPESLKSSDPIHTIALAQVVKDPSILEVMNVREIEQAIAERFNIDLSDRPEQYPPSLKLELASAIKSVSEKVNSIPTKGNESFSILYQQRQQSEAAHASAIEKAKSFWSGEAEKAVSNLSQFTVEVDGEKISVAVSPELRQAIKSEISTGFLTISADKAKETVQKYIENRVVSTQLQDVMKAYRTQIEGKIKEKVVAEAHNGGEVVRRDKPAEKTVAQPYFDAVKEHLSKFSN
jgi:hypothetical protein